MSQNVQHGRILRLTASGKRRSNEEVLSVIPHVNYLRNFTRVEWEPATLGLEEIGMGFEPTLVAAPGWALGWLKCIECVKEAFWDVPLNSRAPFDVWKDLPALPKGMRISEAFLKEGGFINCWKENHKTHLIWGRVEADSAQSILAFVWLQNVLAGGRQWRRRELGSLPEQFKNHLALGYVGIGGPKEQVCSASLGLPRPILRKKDGGLYYTGDWIGSPEKNEHVMADSLEAILLPEIHNQATERNVSFNEKNCEQGVVWNMTEASAPMLLGFYCSSMGAHVDELQEHWNAWMQEHVKEMDTERRAEILLCVREAVLNADQHGCKGERGKRFLLAAQMIEAERTIKVRVSDPGRGHAYNFNSFEARKEQMMGKHLGLRLIHGMATRVKFLNAGSTIEFDFTY